MLLPAPAARSTESALAAGIIPVTRSGFTSPLYVLSDGTEDPDADTRDVLLKKVFPRRAQVIESAALRALLQVTDPT